MEVGRQYLDSSGEFNFVRTQSLSLGKVTTKVDNTLLVLAFCFAEWLGFYGGFLADYYGLY